jgi:transcriptional regulator with XRE-family HTH domain
MRKRNAEQIAFDAAVGRRIESMRKARGIGASQLARRVGITPQRLYWYEVGKGCPLHIIGKIADALALPLTDLMPE